MKVIRIEGDGAKALERALAQLGTVIGKAGWIEGSLYPDPPHPSVAKIAIIQEYGAPSRNIPARPFMRPAVAAHKKEWAALAESGGRAVLQGRLTPSQVMEGITQKAAANIRGAIDTPLVPWLPLSPLTIAMRLSKRHNKQTLGLLDKPLVDTGLMYGTVTNSVENG